MSPRLYRTLQALILAALGIFLLQKIWSGTLYWYISNRFLALTVFAAIGFLVLAQNILPRRRPAAAPVDPDHHDHDHDHGEVAPAWGLLIVALPVLLGLLIPAKPLGAAAIANKGVNTSAPLAASREAVRLDIAPTDRNILDWIRAVNYAADPVSLNGLPADVIGFVYHDSRLGNDEFLAARFTLNCCVADASALGVVVQWPGAASLAGNSWVRVRGAVEASTLDGQRIPFIKAESVESVAEPSQPYLYP
ncbi:MAG: TIGR03943 family protein [Chloroflexi bacterium]|nr:TIGR03943 family protein [Chloroflexota bacterium]